MSQTTQFVSVPLVEGSMTARIASTVWGVGGAEIKNGQITFQAGPDMIGARYISRKVLVQGARKKIPDGYKCAGKVSLGKRKLKVLVELPS